MLDLKQWINKVTAFCSIDVTSPATNVTLVRLGVLRFLILNDATGTAISGVTIGSMERPASDMRAVAFRRTSNASGSSTGMVVLRASSGLVQPYYSSSYGGSVSAVGSSDTVTATLIWIAGA